MSQCPSPLCKAASPLQWELSTKELREAGATGYWTNYAMICVYCGCVYTYEAESGLRPTIRGSLDGPKWEPANPTKSKIEC